MQDLMLQKLRRIRSLRCAYALDWTLPSHYLYDSMTRPELFELTIDILSKGFAAGTIVKGNCHACIIANLIAAAHGITFRINLKTHKPRPRPATIRSVRGYPIHIGQWGEMFHTGSDGIQYICEQAPEIPEIPQQVTAEMCAEDQHDVFELIRPTGYSMRDLMEMEHAFEKNTLFRIREYTKRSRGEVIRDVHAGLIAVVDVLCRHHHASSKEERAAKAAFTHPALIYGP